MPKTRPPYSPEFRRQMVELVRAGRDPAELYRHKGQLLLRQGHFVAAEGLYRKALSIAGTSKPSIFWHPSTAGSPKASRRPISRKQRRCSRRSMRSRLRS